MSERVTCVYFNGWMRQINAFRKSTFKPLDLTMIWSLHQDTFLLNISTDENKTLLDSQEHSFSLPLAVLAKVLPNWRNQNMTFNLNLAIIPRSSVLNISPNIASRKDRKSSVFDSTEGCSMHRTFHRLFRQTQLRHRISDRNGRVITTRQHNIKEWECTLAPNKVVKLKTYHYWILFGEMFCPFDRAYMFCSCSVRVVFCYSWRIMFCFQRKHARH